MALTVKPDVQRTISAHPNLAVELLLSVVGNSAVLSLGLSSPNFDCGVSSLICPNIVSFQNLPEINLIRNQAIYGVPSPPRSPNTAVKYRLAAKRDFDLRYQTKICPNY